MVRLHESIRHISVGVGRIGGCCTRYQSEAQEAGQEEKRFCVRTGLHRDSIGRGVDHSRGPAFLVHSEMKVLHSNGFSGAYQAAAAVVDSNAREISPRPHWPATQSPNVRADFWRACLSAMDSPAHSSP